VVKAWFGDGENRINTMVDVLVRQTNLTTEPELARVTVSARQYKDGTTRLKVPRTYTIGTEHYRPEPGELVHSHLQAALDSLGKVISDESHFWEISQGRESQSIWGTTKDLDEWQSHIEMISHDITGIDTDVKAALSKFSIEIKKYPERAKIIPNAVPLDYDLGGVKVITDPGSLHDLHRMIGIEAQRDANATRVDYGTAESVKAGLLLSQRVLKQRGFGKLWYGTIFVLPPVRAITATTAKTGQSFRAGGHYSHDDIVVNPRYAWKAQTIAELVVHELGHRYWYKFMKAGARARFSAWFDPRSKADQEKEGPKTGYVPAPTSYGAESAVEEFAEVFAAYVMGSYEGITLTGPQKARFEALALGRAAQSEAVHGRSHGMGIRKLVERIEQVMIEWDGYDDTRTDVEALARNIVVLEPVLYNVTLLIRNNRGVHVVG
jgi:hypothetical protein